MRSQIVLVGLLAATLTPVPAGPVAPGKGKAPSPLTPQQALKEFKVAPGLRVELVACEPQIESPVAMQFDEDGRLWVVEMPDYPNGPAKGEKPHGRIKVLEDKDGDGFYETATVFADNLDFANGLLRWKDGVLSFGINDGPDADRFEFRLIDANHAELALILSVEERRQAAAEQIPLPRPFRLTKMP